MTKTLPLTIQRTCPVQPPFSVIYQLVWVESRVIRGTLGLLKPAKSVNPCHFQRTVSKCTQLKKISPVYGRSENGRLSNRVYSVRSLNGCCWHSVVLLLQNHGRISGSKAPSPFLNHGLRTFFPSRLCIWDSLLLFVHHVDADDMPPLVFGQTR